VLAFQPHRYSRTATLYISSRSLARPVLLTEVYAAGEAPIVAMTAEVLTALRVAGRIEPLFVDDVADLPQAIWNSPARVMWCVHGRHPSRQCLEKVRVHKLPERLVLEDKNA
jgi:UDP-N-acetylmuramate-alanine ligase